MKTNKKLRCIAIDDEPFALEIIADDLQKIPFVHLLGTYSNPLDAWEFIKNGEVDLLFLDIQMPTLTGTQFLRKLHQAPMVIFTTAYDQYALEGFELNVLDYLMKPISFERLLRATNKAYELFQLKQLDSTINQTTERGFCFVHSEYKEIKLYYDEILYIEGLKDYVKIYTSQQNRPILTRLNLKAMESKLPIELFCRVHLSYIVSLQKITSFQKTKLHIGKQEIPIGNKFSEQFEAQYRQ